MSRRNGEEGVVRRPYTQKGNMKRRSDVTNTPRLGHWCGDCFGGKALLTTSNCA